jgi:hypothetical protein
MFHDQLQDSGKLLKEIEANAGSKRLPEQVRKRTRADECDSDDMCDLHVDVGQFVEVGADSGQPDVVAEVMKVDTVAGRPLITAPIKSLSSGTVSVLQKEGTIRRKGPDSRDTYGWFIYQPGIKLLLGIASGSRWFSDKAYGGHDVARNAAL